MNDIIKKIETYDKSHGTDFAKIVYEKMNATKKANIPYRRGILHGMFLILNHLEVITPNEAIALLGEVSPDE